MNKQKIIKYILIIPLLFLVKFGVEEVIYSTNKIPEINLEPKEELRIYGRFPFDPQKYYMKAFVYYFASNPKCDTQHLLAGTSSRQEVYQDLNVVVFDDNYKITVYDDYYKRGVCEWKIEDIILNIILKENNQVLYSIAFTTDESVQNRDNTYLSTNPFNFICNYGYSSLTDCMCHYCEDPVQNIMTGQKIIKISNLQKKFEINFNQMTRSARTTKKENKVIRKVTALQGALIADLIYDDLSPKIDQINGTRDDGGNRYTTLAFYSDRITDLQMALLKTEDGRNIVVFRGISSAADIITDAGMSVATLMEGLEPSFHIAGEILANWIRDKGLNSSNTTMRRTRFAYTSHRSR